MDPAIWPLTPSGAGGWEEQYVELEPGWRDTSTSQICLSSLVANKCFCTCLDFTYKHACVKIFTHVLAYFHACRLLAFIVLCSFHAMERHNFGSHPLRGRLRRGMTFSIGGLVFSKGKTWVKNLVTQSFKCQGENLPYQTRYLRWWFVLFDMLKNVYLAGS